MLKPELERHLSLVPENNSSDRAAVGRVCQRCGGAFEPERRLRSTTRFCERCARRNNNERVAAWKRRKIDEIGIKQFRADYEQVPEKRRERMKLYMRKRRAGQSQDELNGLLRAA